VITIAKIPSRAGGLVAAFSEAGLAGLFFSDHRGDDPVARLSARFEVVDAHPDPKLLGAVRTQLEEYFARKRRSFDIPLDLRGTAFQMAVWRELQKIPYGLTATYGGLARKLGSQARAVGGACGANPVSIIVPCHRVVGSDGDLRGFGGGLETKRFLLELEGALQPRLI
jgi:methylated-DNA-[protein]-cysteine S-methyltransferase